jgi:thiol:disulfide interchange protein DsbD
MKNIVFAIAIVLSSISVKCQNPVSWLYSSKKIADKTYEIHLTASIKYGWHLYSQTQPKDAISIPTNIKFIKNHLIKFNGKIKEIGRLEKHKEPTIGIEQWQYSGKVEFVQIVILKSTVNTSISGSIEYQVCSDEKCLPPKMVEFKVAL